MSVDNSRVVAVWSTYGHRFLSEGDHEVCLTCGAAYDLVADADDPTHGEYQASNGDAPTTCTGDTAMLHGEDCGPECQGCEGPRDRGDCNCLLCA